jgi:hypothetical protein
VAGEAVSEPAGVWVAYGMDYGPYPISVHQNELDAHRAAATQYGQVCFWPWDVSLADAVKAAQ